METLSKETAARVRAHLERTGQGFCFVNGAVVSQDDCELVLSGGEVDLY